MKIKLKTNSDDHGLEFLDVERFSDGSGYCAVIMVHSRGFSVEIPFYFEVHPLDAFIENLEKMNQSLIGSARIKPFYEEHFIEFEINALGHVRIRGEMIEYSDMPQRLKFEFETDQTCLSPFIHDLRKWREIKAT